MHLKKKKKKKIKLPLPLALVYLYHPGGSLKSKRYFYCTTCKNEIQQSNDKRNMKSN